MKGKKYSRGPLDALISAGIMSKKQQISRRSELTDDDDQNCNYKNVITTA